MHIEILVEDSSGAMLLEVLLPQWPLPGQVKHEWAKKIAPLMDMDRNVSPSFCKFRDGLRQLCTD